MLFPRIGTGIANLRFPAVSQSINIYKNGRLLSPTEYLYSDSSESKSVKINEYNSSDTYVASYNVDIKTSDPSMVDFSNRFAQQLFLTTYSDDNGLGELLSTSGAENAVALSYTPYVDYSKMSSHTYSERSRNDRPWGQHLLAHKRRS